MLSDIFNTIKKLPSLIIDGLKDFFLSIIGVLKDIFEFIPKIPGLIIDGFKELLTFLFVPSDGFMDTKIGELQSLLEQKLSLDSYNEFINIIKTATAGNMPNISINLFGATLTLIDFKYFADNKDTLHDFVRGFMFMFLIFYNMRNAYKLMRADEIANGSGTNGGGK